MADDWKEKSNYGVKLISEEKELPPLSSAIDLDR